MNTVAHSRTSWIGGHLLVFCLFVAATAGKLMLGVNQAASNTGTGSYKVRLQVTSK